MKKKKLKVTHGNLEDSLTVHAVNATVRYDGNNTNGSNKYDILLDCSARLAMERLEICTHYQQARELVFLDRDSGVFHSTTRGLLVFEYAGIPNRLRIITASCHEKDKSDEELHDYLQQALNEARTYAEKRYKI